MRLDSYTARVLQGYEDAADFTDTDSLGRDAEEHGIECIGWAPETLETFKSDVVDFVNGLETDGIDVSGIDPEQIGHDFWLTRNRHGCGFWDGDYAEPLGKTLTDAAHAYGSRELYVGDDGLIYSV